MIGSESVFDYILEDASDTDGLLESFIINLNQVVGEYEQRNFTGPKNVYEDIRQRLSLNKTESIDLDTLKDVEDNYFGSGNFVSYNLEDCFDELVAETYREMEEEFLNEAATEIKSGL